jgi:hypothetical protein
MKVKSASKLASYFDAKNQYEFCVYLTTLVGGHGGSTRTTILLFNYNTPFHRFEKILQEETGLCHVPLANIIQTPVIQESRDSSGEVRSESNTHDPSNSSTQTGLTEVASPSHLVPSIEAEAEYDPLFRLDNFQNEAISSDSLNGLKEHKSDERTSVSDTTRTMSSDTITGASNLSSSDITTPIFSAYGFKWVNTPQTSNPCVRGFTVADGPWSCGIAAIDGTRGSFRNVDNERCYMMLVDQIKTANKKNPKNEHKLMVMHVRSFPSRIVLFYYRMRDN